MQELLTDKFAIPRKNREIAELKRKRRMRERANFDENFVEKNAEATENYMEQYA